jgi:cystathionine beta-lyase
MKFASRLVSFDPAPGDRFRPISTPIYQTATFEQENADSFGDYDYSRSGNPTRTVLETHLAGLENGTRGFAFASGMAAISTVTKLLRSGDEILADNDLYGGTCRLFSKVLDRTGITARYADARNLEHFRKQITPNTRLIYAETPTNPLLRIVDLRKLAELAHEHGALLCVDNSTMSPYLQNPLDLGADIVLHSATKFLGGHHDVTAGVIVVKDAELADKIYFVQNAEGNSLAPFDCYLLLRGIKTLKLRLDCQQRNASTIAQFLLGRKGISQVYYPGLVNDRGYELQRSQARGAGAVLSFTTGSFEMSKAIAEQARLFRITVSFGSVNSSISLPGTMSHASVPPEVLAQRDLPEDLVRISVGIEDEEDLIDDLDRAIQEALVPIPDAAPKTRISVFGNSATDESQLEPSVPTSVRQVAPQQLL